MQHADQGALAAQDPRMDGSKLRIAIVQATLRCGTGCGSCLPALQSLARSAVAASAAAGEALAVS